MLERIYGKWLVALLQPRKQIDKKADFNPHNPNGGEVLDMVTIELKGNRTQLPKQIRGPSDQTIVITQPDMSGTRMKEHMADYVWDVTQSHETHAEIITI